MKESLLELLIDLFEKTITQLKETSKQHHSVSSDKPMIQLSLLQPSTSDAFRYFILEEKMRLTTAGYHLLYKLMIWRVIPVDMMELVINRLLFSESRTIEIDEIKWTIRNTMNSMLDAGQLAFLDLVLYDTNDNLVAH